MLEKLQAAIERVGLRMQLTAVQSHPRHASFVSA